MLRHNQSYRFSSDVISPGEARRLSLDAISPEASYSSENMSSGIIRRLLECNKSCGLFECKRSPGVVHMLLKCNTP